MTARRRLSSPPVCLIGWCRVIVPEEGFLCRTHFSRQETYELDGWAELDEIEGDGRCRVCKAPGAALDHNHSTGKVRGLLCHPCNRALGFADDSPRRLLALATYLLTEGHYGP